MSDPRRPTVQFEVHVSLGARGPVVGPDGQLPRFVFPGGADWNGAVRDACHEHLGLVAEAIVFDRLVDDGNVATGTAPWIGVRFAVEVADGARLRAPWRWA